MTFTASKAESGSVITQLVMAGLPDKDDANIYIVQSNQRNSLAIEDQRTNLQRSTSDEAECYNEPVVVAANAIARSFRDGAGRYDSAI